MRCFPLCEPLPGGGKKSKEIVSGAYTKIFRMDEFAGGVGDGSTVGKLGSHSIRKFASTHVHRSGINKDDKDIRGRWKLAKRVSDVYDDVELPFPDAKVADKLCIGGPCYYLCLMSCWQRLLVVVMVRRCRFDTCA